MITTERINDIFDKIGNISITVFGELCLDAYWVLNPEGGEISVETGLKANTVQKHYYTLGASSNIIANLAALQPKKISGIGVVGDDIFGRELSRKFNQLNINCDGIIIQDENFDTAVFGKTYLSDNELPRMDFGFFNKKTANTNKLLLLNLKRALQADDVVIINQQIPSSFDEEFIKELNAIFDEFNDKLILLDSRHYSNKFKNIIRKTNSVEAARLIGQKAEFNDVIPTNDLKKYASTLFEQSNKPVFITQGAKGIIAADKYGTYEVPGIQIIGKTDTVGCGDTALSVLALTLATGATACEAAIIANFAASVTAQKLFQTGTANFDEILKAAENVDYIYSPELATDIRKAVYIKGSDIEICCEEDSLQFGKIKHAVFDHDGTISTLRQGWEAIMEPVMIKAILGDKYSSADETIYHRVCRRVQEYIDKSTGIETVKQMQGLVEMIIEFGFVPQDQILDKWGYKKIYNDALLEMVNKRIEKFRDKQLDLCDFTIKGSVDFLKFLRNKGVTLYLASGTDYDDVVSEAQILGYAELFNGGIYGAVGDSEKFSKRTIIKKIITDHDLQGPELLVVGDGPVEMRECRRKDGIALGIASDEVRRYSLNTEKRDRLIKAGAYLITPDFSQIENLMKILFP